MPDPVIDQNNPPVQTTGPDPQVEAEARRGGWKPKDQFTGDPTLWVDAPEFVRRGKEILPHVQRHASRLEQENQALRAQQERLAQEQAALQAQVAGLTQFRQEMDQQHRERLRAEIIAEIKAARTAGDVDRETNALDRLSKTNQPVSPPAVQQPPAVVPPPAQPARTQLPAELTNWVQANEWYQRDPVLQHAMSTVGADLRASGALAGMTLTEQLNETARHVLQRYAPPPATAPSRVEGGGAPGSGGGGVHRPAENSWETLPAHIKSACDEQGKRLDLIGPKKAFKTQDDWRRHYVAEYFRYAPGTGYDFRPPGN